MVKNDVFKDFFQKIIDFFADLHNIFVFLQ